MTRKSEKDIHTKVKSGDMCQFDGWNRIKPDDPDCVRGDWYPAGWPWHCEAWCSYKLGEDACGRVKPGDKGQCGDARNDGNTTGIMAVKDGKYFKPGVFSSPEALPYPPTSENADTYQCFCGPPPPPALKPSSKCVVSGNKDTDIIYQADSINGVVPERISCYLNFDSTAFWQVRPDPRNHGDSGIGDDCIIYFRDPLFKEAEPDCYGPDNRTCEIKGSITDVTRGPNRIIKSMSCNPKNPGDSVYLNKWIKSTSVTISLV